MKLLPRKALIKQKELELELAKLKAEMAKKRPVSKTRSSKGAKSRPPKPTGDTSDEEPVTEGATASAAASGTAEGYKWSEADKARSGYKWYSSRI